MDRLAQLISFFAILSVLWSGRLNALSYSFNRFSLREEIVGFCVVSIPRRNIQLKSLERRGTDDDNTFGKVVKNLF